MPYGVSDPPMDPPDADHPKMDHPHTDHPAEALLEVLVLAAHELSPPVHEAVTAHARGCAMCRSVLQLLLQFHRAVDAEVASTHADPLVRAVFLENDAVRPGLTTGEAAGV